MISVQNVTKRYGSVVALDDISFEVSAGEVLGFLGPNGAGKAEDAGEATEDAGEATEDAGEATEDAGEAIEDAVEPGEDAAPG